MSNPFRCIGNGFKIAGRAINKYTSPRPGTGGNFEPNGYSSFAPALFQAGTEGCYFMGSMGLFGIASGIASCAAGLITEKKLKSLPLGITVSSIVGAGLMAATAILTHAPGGYIIPAVGGALLGVQQLFRGNPYSKVRDSAGNATLLTGLFMPKAFKLSGGIASGLATRVTDSKAAQIAIGAASGAAIAAGLCIGGILTGPMWIPIAVSAGAGIIGPTLGPRFSQFFRNLSEDTGKLVGKGLDKMLGRKVSDRVKTAIGAIPSSIGKEGTRGLINTDLDPMGFLIGSISESLQQAYIFMFSERGDKKPSVTDKLLEKKKVENPIKKEPRVYYGTFY